MYRTLHVQGEILAREEDLRAWFTRHADPLGCEIDGLDIGWGGIQRWATRRMSLSQEGPHLDFACGYGTFLAQIGWRFPDARLIGLNIDYEGPHAQIHELLAQAGVEATLVQADARRMPFADHVFTSVSCFLGLQDIRIGFGEGAVHEALAEGIRVLRPKGTLVLLDEFPFERFGALLDGFPIKVMDRAERALEVRWTRQVAERAIKLYAEGWLAQSRLETPRERERLYDEVYARMLAEMEQQLSNQGYYVPFGPVRIVVAQRTYST